MKPFKKLLSTTFALAAVVCLALTTAGCGSQQTPASQSASSAAPAEASAAPAQLSLAYQYGLAYAPLILCQENKLIEQAYKDATGQDVEVIWNQMSSGADINTGIASGNINVGFMGIAPAISGISKKVNYKIFSNISGQEHGMMSNDPEINKLGDVIGSSKQIALVNIGSIQHIILGKALADNGYGAHDLDANLAAMKHPDGMNALESNSISCHLTTNPYIYKERDNSALHEIPEIRESWSPENSFIVGVASTDLYENNPELYKALCSAVASAIDTINSDLEGTAKITCEYTGNTYEDELKYLGAGSYSTNTKGIFELAQFMHENEFIDNGFESYSDLVFENVTGD